MLKIFRTKGFCNGDISDDGDERYNQDAKLEILGHVNETFSLVLANCSRKWRRFDTRQTSIDVACKDEGCSIVHLENVRRNCAKDDYESVPSRTDYPKKSLQRGIGNFFVL